MIRALKAQYKLFFRFDREARLACRQILECRLNFIECSKSQSNNNATTMCPISCRSSESIQFRELFNTKVCYSKSSIISLIQLKSIRSLSFIFEFYVSIFVTCGRHRVYAFILQTIFEQVAQKHTRKKC